MFLSRWHGPLALCGVAEQSMGHRLEELERRRQAALHAGSEAAVERQHARGKMTARERLDYLLDAGSFQELDMLARSRAEGASEDSRAYTDGVVTGFGTVEGNRICVFSQDFTVNGGTLGEVSGVLSQMEFRPHIGELKPSTRMLSESSLWAGTFAAEIREVSRMADGNVGAETLCFFRRGKNDDE